MDNYIAPLRRAWNGTWLRSDGPYRRHKLVVVGLVKPFYYTMMAADMSKAGREAREQPLDKLYFGRARKDMLKAQLLHMTWKNSYRWVWRAARGT